MFISIKSGQFIALHDQARSIANWVGRAKSKVINFNNKLMSMTTLISSHYSNSGIEIILWWMTIKAVLF